MSVQNIFNDISNKFVDLAKYAKTGRAVDSFKSMDDSQKQHLAIKTAVIALATFTVARFIPVIPPIVTVSAAVFFSVMNDLMNHDSAYHGFVFGQQTAQDIQAAINSVKSFFSGLIAQGQKLGTK